MNLPFYFVTKFVQLRPNYIIKRYSNMKLLRPLLLIVSLLFFYSCSKTYEMELANPIEHGGEIWQGYFVIHNGVHVPMTLGIREDTRGNREGYLVSGTETHRDNIWTEGDSVKMEGGLHSMLQWKFETDSTLWGVLEDGINRVERRTKFFLKKGDAPRFKQVENASPISLTGTWNLEFEMDSIPFTLRYDIRQARSIDFFRTNDTIIGEGRAYGAGKQGWDGVMTEKGFVCASYHKSEVFLMEATFVDQNHFDAVVTTIDNVYNIKGIRKNQLKEDVEFSSSVFVGFLLFVKAFFGL